MAKTVKTKQLEHMLWRKYIEHKMGVYGCFEVTLNNRDAWNQIGSREIVDFILYENKNIFRCFEIKVSKSDFNSNSKVSFYGDYNYYAMPNELYEEIKDKVPYKIGVINQYGEVIKNAKKMQVSFYVRAMLIENMMKSIHREQYKFYQLKGYWE